MIDPRVLYMARRGDLEAAREAARQAQRIEDEPALRCAARWLIDGGEPWWVAIEGIPGERAEAVDLIARERGNDALSSPLDTWGCAPRVLEVASHRVALRWEAGALRCFLCDVVEGLLLSRLSDREEREALGVLLSLARQYAAGELDLEALKQHRAPLERYRYRVASLTALDNMIARAALGTATDDARVPGEVAELVWSVAVARHLQQGAEVPWLMVVWSGLPQLAAPLWAPLRWSWQLLSRQHLALVEQDHQNLTRMLLDRVLDRGRA